jgi:hypothetical protein
VTHIEQEFPSCLVSVSELAAIVGQSPDSIERHRRCGRITGYKVGPRAVRYDRDAALRALVKPIPNPREVKTAPREKVAR